MGHLYFVRHGQTVWNVENKICGATDIELREPLKTRLKIFHFPLIFSIIKL